MCVCAFGVGEFCFILMLLKPKKSLLWSEKVIKVRKKSESDLEH